jgi:hypothetical protein
MVGVHFQKADDMGGAGGGSGSRRVKWLTYNTATARRCSKAAVARCLYRACWVGCSSLRRSL